jgi:serine/threonine protein kinase/tetratricopeptide (TPR) repeat protein
MEHIPKKFNKYIIQELLGIGGSGRVYRISDPDSPDDLALKVFRSTDTGEDTTSRLRFRREFRAASRLEHPHLVRVFETGILDNQEYYTMEYVDGSDFEEHLDQFTTSLVGPDTFNSPERVQHILDLMIQIADALAYLHINRYVHRDIKPGNVLVSFDGTVKLADFGLVRDMGSSHLTHTGAIIGTVEYMSPEQTVTAKVDSRSDIYSLGLMFYKACTGSLPFKGGLMQQLMARAKDEVPDPRNKNLKLDKRISSVICKMLKRRPKDRYPDVQILLDDLVSVREDLFGESPITSTTALTIEAPASFLLPPVCVGRDTELGALQTSLDELRNKGTSSLFMIEGGAGSGKSRLAEEIRTIASFHGIPFLFSSCLEEVGWDYQPWINVFDALKMEFERRNIDSEGTEKTKETLFKIVSEFKQTDDIDGVSGSPEAIKYKFFDASHRYLSTFSSRVPVIIHLDDFHLSSNASAELLQFVTRRTIFPTELSLTQDFSGRVMLLVSYRENELPDNHSLRRFKQLVGRKDHFHHFHLSSLTEEHIREMIVSMLGGEHASPNFSERIFRETNGNPLFVENTINMLVEEGMLRRRGGIWVGAISRSESFSDSDTMSLVLPASIKESFRRRLASVGELEHRVAQAASVLEDPTGFEILLHVSQIDEDDLLDALDNLIKAGLFEEKSAEDETYGFSSLHMRDVVREDLPEDQCRKLHGLAADYIEAKHPDPSVDVLSVLAFHFSQAQHRRKAYDACKQVAGYHFNKGNIERALVFADLALRSVSGQPADDGLNLTRAQCLLHLGRLREAGELFRDCVRRTTRNLRGYPEGSPPPHSLSQQHCQALLGLAQIKKIESNLEGVKRFLEVLLKKSHKYNEKQIFAMSMTLLGAVTTDQGYLEEALVCLHKALAFSERESFRDITTKCHHNIGNVYYLKSDYKNARHHYSQALNLAESAGDQLETAALKVNLGNILKKTGKYNEALSMYQEAVKSAENLGDYASWPLYLQNQAMIQARLGRADEAIRNFRRALAVFEELGSLDQVAICSNNLGNTLYESGNCQEAYHILKQAYDHFSSLGYHISAGAVLVNLGAVSLELGLLDQSKSYLDKALTVYEKTGPAVGSTECHLFYARLNLKQDNPEEARDRLNKMNLEQLVDPLSKGYYHWFRGELGITLETRGTLQVDTEQELQTAISFINQAGQYPYLIRQIELMLGNYLISTGKNTQKGEDLLLKHEG